MSNKTFPTINLAEPTEMKSKKPSREISRRDLLKYSSVAAVAAGATALLERIPMRPADLTSPIRIPEVAGTTPFDPVFIIYQSGTSYVGSPTSLYSALSQQSNSTPDLAALVKACWDTMTANSVYGKIIIMPGTNAYLWATSIAPISNMALVGHSNSEWFTGSAGPATVIKIANGLNNYAFKWVGHIHNGESGLSLPG